MGVLVVVLDAVEFDLGSMSFSDNHDIIFLNEVSEFKELGLGDARVEVKQGVGVPETNAEWLEETFWREREADVRLVEIARVRLPSPVPKTGSKPWGARDFIKSSISQS